MARQDCVFAHRFEADTDRAYRHPRSGTSQGLGQGGLDDTNGTPTLARESNQAQNSPTIGTAASEGGLPVHSPAGSLVSQPSISTQRIGWESLPPYDEVFDGVQTLTTSFFQLGFLPRTLFFEKLRKDRGSVDIFLLLGILSVSARFTPSLVRRYQGGGNATQVFLGQATCLVQGQMFTPTLESIQGFFLMSIAEWGNGDKHRSLVYMGIAIRLAGILRMHREDTYHLSENASEEDVVYSEVARRTFWMLETFENLHSGADSPTAFSYNDITVLLPCDEREFTFGIRPTSRAALIGTPPANKNPSLTLLPSRSLFATLLQTHSLWGQVARLVSAEAVQAGARAGSGVSAGSYGRLSQALVEFEAGVPQQHSWSVWNLRGFKVEGLDLAYLSAVMVLRLSNIILRRSYLHDILKAQNQRDRVSGSLRMESCSVVADQLFENMLKLHEQIMAFFEYRSPDQGYPALIVFCVYVCGCLANHLQQQPQLCPVVAPQAAQILQRSIRGLGELQNAWPLARRWYLALCKVSENTILDSPVAIMDPVNGTAARFGPESGHPAEDSVHEVPSLGIQFSDPFLSNSMFDAFDSYLWSNLANMNEGGLYGESLAVNPWGNS